jgi:hypothetical protein
MSISMKRLLLACGLIGFVGCFLPLLGPLSWFDLRHEVGWTAWLVIAAYAVSAIVGLSKTPLRRADAAAALTAFGFVLWHFHGDILKLIIHTRIGGMMMGIAAVAGFLISLASLIQSAKVKPV